MRRPNRQTKSAVEAGNRFHGAFLFVAQEGQTISRYWAVASGTLA